MKSIKIVTIWVGVVGIATLPLFLSNASVKPKAKGCVFQTLFGLESSDSMFIYKTPEKVISSIDKGLLFLSNAQQSNGGFGAGLSSRQDIMDPLAVKTDPATTAMVAMAMMRSGSNLKTGLYQNQLNRALQYLLSAVEKAPNDKLNITNEVGTQIQVKLGQNIDAILTSQFLSNVIEFTSADSKLQNRTQKCLAACVERIQKAQDVNGAIKGSGWAGVLQSSLATNAIESAQERGVSVDTIKLQQSRDFQESNFDQKTGTINTAMGAGVVLYSVSSTARATAKDSRKVREQMIKAVKEGKLKKDDKVTAENLEKAGFSNGDAMKYNASYNANTTTNSIAQQSNVMSGFGNNGGEEFLSYQQTGESLIIGKDTTWTKWYDNISGHMLSIQNSDGSWSGHHCITSPVFCTATSLLILSINNDAEKLLSLGKSNSYSRK
jgi:hypothetical protein